MSHDAFLQAVIAAPDDDAPRLVYADWLDEQGDADRAEFIRVQCASAAAPEDDPRHVEWSAREHELLEKHAWRWALDLQSQVSEWRYRRGFIEQVETSLQRPGDELVALLQLAPIRHLRDSAQTSDLRGLIAALPHFGRLTGLEFWEMYTVDDAQLRELCLSPHLRNLKSFVLQYDARGRFADERVMLDFLRSPYRDVLEELTVNVDGVSRGPSSALLRAMADSPSLRRLRKLRLTHIGADLNATHRDAIDAATIRELGASPNLTGLEYLELAGAGLTSDVWEEVLQWPCLPNLVRLTLRDARLVNPPSMMTIAELIEADDLRARFDARTHVDWHSESFDLWGDGVTWRGYSWTLLSQQHLHRISEFLAVGDYPGLVEAFRRDCRDYAGEAAAQEVDALPFLEYERELQASLERAVALVHDYPECAAIWLRVRPDLFGASEFSLEAAPIPDFDLVGTDYEFQEPLASEEGPLLAEASAFYEDHPSVGPLDPGAARHYVYARLLAAFGRGAARVPSPVPIEFSCLHARFRIAEIPSV